MIEVLVAATILVVIVMMLGMLFQQTSLAWRTGVKRADGFMQVRSAIGTIQRDAAAAVDARELRRRRLEIDPSDQILKEDQRFSASLMFYTLSGSERALTKVTYDTAGNRTESTLLGTGSWGPVRKTNVLTFAERQSSKNRPKTTLGSFTPEWGDLDQNGLPLYVTFTARVITSGYTLDIGAASAGPDKVWNTKDDIKTWVEK